MQRFQSGQGDFAGEALAIGEFDLITRDLARSTGAGRVVLALRDEDGSIGAASGWGEHLGTESPPRALSPGGFASRVVETERSASEPIDGDGTLTYAVGAPVQAFASPPGALCAAFAVTPEPAETRWVVESYARLASLSLHDPFVLDGLLSSARLDGLTGCLNYGALRQELNSELARASRHGRDLSCCFIDLDRFKQVNDHYGHLHGSRVLASVAAMLDEGMRDGDRLGRYGGDEFVAVLPDTDEAAALGLGERLRERISGATGGRRLDASVGVAQWVPGTNADEMLAAADDALRSVKEGGGGAVIKATDLRRAPVAVPVAAEASRRLA
jgi:diguanylate cyclase (GGDEF)-like protein